MSAQKSYVPINYGATAVLASLGQTPIGAKALTPKAHETGDAIGDILAEFADEPKLALVAPPKRKLTVAERKAARKGNERPECRERCGRKAPHFSKTGLCVVCEDQQKMAQFGKSTTAQSAPVITSRSDIPSQGLVTVTFMGTIYQFRKLGRGGMPWRLSNEQNEMLSPGQVGLDHDVARLILMYVNGKVDRAEVNDALRLLAKAQASPAVGSNSTRYMPMLEEIWAIMGPEYIRDFMRMKGEKNA